MPFKCDRQRRLKGSATEAGERRKVIKRSGQVG